MLEENDCCAALDVFPTVIISPSRTESAPEQRKSLRKEFCHTGKILVQGSAALPFRTVDISVGGIGGIVGEPFATGSKCAIALDLPIESKTRRINAWGEIVHCDATALKFRVGIKYQDFDSLSRLYLFQLST